MQSRLEGSFVSTDEAFGLPAFLLYAEMKETIEAAKKILSQKWIADCQKQPYADCSVQPYSLRTDILLCVPVQPVIVLHALSSKCTCTSAPKFSSKQKVQSKEMETTVSPLLPPAFSPTVSTACTKYSCLYFRIPRQQSPQPHSWQNFIRTILLDAKLLAHSFLLTTSYVVLLIIKAKYLGILQSGHNSYPSCFTTL